MRRKAVAVALSALLGTLIAVTISGCSRDPEKGKRKYLESGLRYMKKGRFREASLQFRSALKLDTRYVDALYYLAQAQMSLQDWSGAYAGLQRAIQLDPDRADVRLSLGGLYVRTKEYAKAEEEANFVIARDPKNAAAYEILSISLMLQQEKEKAREALLKLTELSPQSSNRLLKF